MKVRVRVTLLVGCILSCALHAVAASPGAKRTIFTSGDKVHTIRYQLGQSTILFFGLKPETVVGGNNNYFNIEKLKDGVTIQPLAGFSTNLTVFAAGRRYLFYLTPAGTSQPDGFVDVKWIAPADVRIVSQGPTRSTEVTKNIDAKVRIDRNLELTVKQERSLSSGRCIYDLELRNSGRTDLNVADVTILAEQNGKLLEQQVTAWEGDEVPARKSLKGRLIISGKAPKGPTLLIGHKGRSTSLKVANGRR